MADDSNSSEPKQLSDAEFNKRVKILFYWGLLPSVLFSGSAAMVVAATYDALLNWRWFWLLFWGVASIVWCFVGISTGKRRGLSVAALVASMICSTLYIHILINATDGHRSPFVHFYLYMPAVVYMVTYTRWYLELISAAAMLVSYCITHTASSPWDHWITFRDNKACPYFDHIVIIVLFVCLFAVNRLIERLYMHRNNHV